jgi:hypothetical protein
MHFGPHPIVQLACDYTRSIFRLDGRPPDKGMEWKSNSVVQVSGVPSDFNLFRLGAVGGATRRSSCPIR